MKYDGSLSIATGASRKETRWKNKEVLWSDLLADLSNTTRTRETVKEYEKATKALKDNIKDVGGFVGGTLANGRRKAGNVLGRSMLTLDVDNASPDFLENYTMLFDNAACIYSTHSHVPGKPRLRLLVPLSREVNRDEYEALGRKHAESFIEECDDSTFQPERLMYWPSTPSDGEFVFEWQDGPWLDPDEVLAEYRDWRDSSMWPVSSRVSGLVARSLKKQEDPTTKDGPVGAFCRAYDIREAIETFLSRHYEKCDAGDGRYTYKLGSTAGGLVIYEDKYAYSHHGTDPTGGKLCNAFDLVRVHLFGDKDENTSDRTNITKYPSYLAMLDLVSKDPRAKKQMFHDRLESARSDFDDVEPEEAEYGDWAEELEYDRKNNLLPTPENVRLIMENDPNLEGVFGNDLFSRRITLFKEPFWRKGVEGLEQFWNDTDDAELRLYLGGKRWGIKGRDLISDTFKSVSARRSIHPIRDYLQGLEWDGKKRLETIFIDALGVEDSEYTRAVTRAMFVAGVQRVLEPGSYMDYTMVFVGTEGIGKSKLLGRIARRPAWFVDSCPITGKDAYENIRGKWIVEIAELVGLRKNGTDEVKNFLSKTSDFYRAAYDRYPQDQPRQCVFFGSGNNLNFLQGIGGDRRFWPCKVNEANVKKNWSEYTEEELDQLWAEALVLFKGGARPFLSKKLEAVARLKQREHTEVDTWEDVIDEFLEKPVPKGWENMPEATSDFFEDGEASVKRDSVTIREIWELGFGERKPIDYTSQSRIKKIMDRKQGWEYKKFRRGGKTYNGFERGK